ncbi:MAG: DUF1778 domain-containing protein [Candidatus Adiutrix sp.]|jgi:uncharacterized protein (DUF1778 family)|nr:DUF1778 domain-containing protein [Candidatus Adiutrix sp.]
MPLSSPSKTERINLRASPAAKTLLQEAAEACQKSVSEFILEASLTQAQQALADRRIFKLDEKAWKEFQRILDRPVASKPRLKMLLKA